MYKFLNKYKYYILFSILVIYLILKYRNVENLDMKNLRFSNTQQWNPKILNSIDNMNEKQHYILNIMKKYLKNYPPNNSKETKLELRELLKLQKIRTKEMEKNINIEKTLEGIMSRFNLPNKEDVENIVKINNFIYPIIAFFKVYYDRVRPSFLSKKLKPYIKIPNHSSYPSGHTLQSYIIAYYLSEKYPHNKEKYFYIAHNIAKNREIAGVHYSSDTYYGKFLAKKLYSLISKYHIENLL